jgi:hypothetical protein
MSNKSFSIKENPYMKDIQGGEKKVMKKILSVALSTAMAFSMFASVAFGADAEKLTPEQQFNVLKEAGIVQGYPDGMSHLDRTVTRAELAKIIVKSMALEEVTGVATYKDKNYTAKHWAAPFIESATKAGILKGVSTNPANPLFNPTGNVTVQELAKVLVEANKLEVPTEANNTASEWAKGYVAAAIKAGYIAEGINYQANATRAQTVVAAHAIYEFNNFKVTKAEAIDANNVKLTLSTGEVVEVKLEKALEANKATELTYKAKDGRELKYTVTYVVTAATKIESVTATNYKELTVKFDGDVDAKTAENTDNYTISGISFKSAKLSADKKEVKLLINENSGTLPKQKETTLTVKGVKNANASKTFDEKVKFTAVDTQLPEVTEVKALGTKAIKVVFSEPVTSVTAGNLGNYKIDGKAISGYTKFTYPNIVFITTDVSVGEHKLTVQNVQDFNEFKVSPAEHNITVVEDTTAPEIVSVKSTDLKKLEVEFNEPVKSVKKAYQTSSNKTATVEIADNIVTLTFDNDNRLSLGETTVYLEGVTDYSNNSADRNATVKPELDTTRPEVSSVKSEVKGTDSFTTITVEFSKSVLEDDIKKSENFVLRNDKGEIYSGKGFTTKGNPVNTPVYAKDSSNKNVESKVVLTSIGKLPAGKYSLEILGIRDQASIGNTLIPVKVDFNVTESDAVKLASAWFVNESNNDDLYVYVQFNKNLENSGSGRADEINKYSYLVGGTSGTIIPFPANHATAEIYNADTVRITVPKKEVSQLMTAIANGDALAVRAINVSDTNGNYLASGVYDLINSADSVIKYSSDVDAIKAVDKKTVKIKTNTRVDYVSKEDFVFEVKKDGAFSTINSNEYSVSGTEDNGKVIVVTFTSDIIPTDVENNFNVKTVAQANISSADSYGRKLQAFTTAKPVYDAVKPEFVKDSGAAVGKKITLKFSEEIKVNYTPAAFTVAVNGDKKDIVTAEKGTDVNTLVITTKDAIASGDIVEVYSNKNADGKFVTDVNGNAAEDFSSGRIVATVDVVGNANAAATAAVVSAEGAALTTTAQITTAEGLVTDAETLVTALTDATVKADLQGRIDAVKVKIDLAKSKIALATAIDAAQTKHDGATEGAAQGNYAVGSKATYKTAIDAAKGVLDNTASTKAQLDQALTDLGTATNDFEAGKVA